MERLKRLRSEKGLSQARLAARAELDPSTVNQIERGAREASPATLRKLADALGVSLYDLLEEEAPKAQAPLPLDSGEERGHYPYPWMGDTLARLMKDWEQSMEEGEVDGRYAHAIAMAAFDALGAVILTGDPGETMRERAPANEVDERNRVADRLYRLSSRAIDRYRESDVFESDEEYRLEAKFQKIVEENDLEAILSDVQSDA